MRTNFRKPFLVIKGLVTAGKPTTADVGKAANALSAVAHGIASQRDTIRGPHGDYDTKMVPVLPAVWKDRAGFEKATGGAATDVAVLANVAAGGDADEIAAQFGSTGQHGCGGCQKPFRGDKVK